jgi:hypothetical protein
MSQLQQEIAKNCMFPFRTAWFLVAVFGLSFADDGACGLILLAENTGSAELHPPVPSQRSNWTCKSFAATGLVPSRCCCGFPGDTPTCLPSLVVMGAQKSGSTALFGYFLFHPQISPAKRKEVHFFDRSFRASPQRADAKTYLMNFREMKLNMVRRLVRHVLDRVASRVCIG